MRTNEELIAELKAETSKATVVFLAVGFPEETHTIPGNLTQSRTLEILNDLVRFGGTPLGFIRCFCDGRRHTFCMRVLQEHIDAGDDEEVGEVLAKIIREFAAEELRRVNDARN